MNKFLTIQSSYSQKITIMKIAGLHW